MDTGELASVAVLSVLGTLLMRRFQIPSRILALVPILLSTAIVWAFIDLPTAQQTIVNGIVSGLLAGGLLYISQGLLKSE